MLQHARREREVGHAYGCDDSCQNGKEGDEGGCTEQERFSAAHSVDDEGNEADIAFS